MMRKSVDCERAGGMLSRFEGRRAGMDVRFPLGTGSLTLVSFEEGLRAPQERDAACRGAWQIVR